jgi:hypothetical protein
MLIEVICLFFPALLCVCIYERLTKITLCLRRWVYTFAFDTLFINLFCFAVKSYLLDSSGHPLRSDGISMTPHAALNYLLITIPFAVIWAVVAALLPQKVTVEIEANENEKN